MRPRYSPKIVSRGQEQSPSLALAATTVHKRYHTLLIVMRYCCRPGHAHRVSRVEPAPTALLVERNAHWTVVIAASLCFFEFSGDISVWLLREMLGHFSYQVRFEGWLRASECDPQPLVVADRTLRLSCIAVHPTSLSRRGGHRRRGRGTYLARLRSLPRLRRLRLQARTCSLFLNNIG